jgi:hypothetical protein
MSRKELIKRAHEYAESTFISHLDLDKEDPDGEKSMHNMRSMAYFEGSLYAITLFLAECEKEAIKPEKNSVTQFEPLIEIKTIKQIAARLKGEQSKQAQGGE